MARGKTKIARIADEKVLKSTFQKRKKGLIKKIKELATLCDIVACIVIYSPAIGGRPPEIFTWPEEHDRVLDAIRMYKEKMENSRRTADLWNYLNNRRLNPDMSSDHHYHHQENMALSGGGVYEKAGMPKEVAMAYLKWVEARIKAVEERIDLVKNSNSLMMFGNDQFHNDIFQADQVQNLGYGFLQEWPYLQNPYEDLAQYDFNVCDQTLCSHGGNIDPMYMNLAPDANQFQQFIDPNVSSCYQENLNQNQMCLYDPSLLGIEQSNSMADMSQCYQQQQQQNDENMQFLSNVTQTQAQPLMSSNIDDMMQICPYLEDWSSPDAVPSEYSSSSSNQLNRTLLDDLLEEFFSTEEEFVDESQTLGDAAGAEGTIPSNLFGI